MQRPILAALALGAMLFVLSGLTMCRLPAAGSFPIIVSSESITLAWDPPAVQFPSPPLAPFAYRVYYSQHGTHNWFFIGEILASANPQFTIRHSDLGDGLFDFAVATVNSQGGGSSLHTSLDSSTSPTGGWHIFWVSSD